MKVDLEINSKQVPDYSRSNPLNVLKIYRDIKMLRDYFATNIYGKMAVKFRNTAGRRVMDYLFDVMEPISVISVSHDMKKKVAALESLLVLWRKIYDGIEFILTLPDGAGMSLRQAGYIFELMDKVEEQDRALKKTFVCQTPESTE